MLKNKLKLSKNDPECCWIFQKILGCSKMRSIFSLERTRELSGPQLLLSHGFIQPKKGSLKENNELVLPQSRPQVSYRAACYQSNLDLHLARLASPHSGCSYSNVPSTFQPHSYSTFQLKPKDNSSSNLLSPNSNRVITFSHSLTHSLTRFSLILPEKFTIIKSKRSRSCSSSRAEACSNRTPSPLRTHPLTITPKSVEFYSHSLHKET